MSVSVKSISVSIDGKNSKNFDISLEGGKYLLDNFTLSHRLLSPGVLTFTMYKGPVEDIGEATFSVCGAIIGKEIKLSLSTEAIGKGNGVGDVEFKGVITSASGVRNSTEYSVRVEARSWDALLQDNPNCKSFENMSLGDIVKDVLNDYSGRIDSQVSPRYTETIPYCVQYNETNYQFLSRLAARYGEWMYYDGKKFVFGELPKGDTVKLSYSGCGQDISSYEAELKIQHVAFKHVSSSYNSNEADIKNGLDEMSGQYNRLNEKVFTASKNNYTKETLQNLNFGGYSDEDSRESVLGVSTKVQACAEKAGMLVYSGSTYCSKMKVSSVLAIEDNYITDKSTDSKSNVNQDEILVTELVHSFSSELTYENFFIGIPSSCEYPPYFKTATYPKASSSRAKVKDNEDPNHLGRVRVQFDWQAQQDEAMMTPWLRVSQPYGGGNKGVSFIPEVGEEVMVDFEGGDAERPYVKGSLFNGVDLPDSAWLPGSNQVKAIRTRNGHTVEIWDSGEGGYIRIYDNGKENYILTFSTDDKLIKLESKGNIELHAEKDIILEAGHDITATAGNDVSVTADHDVSVDAGNDMNRTVGNNAAEQVGNDRTSNVNRNDSLTVSGNQFVEVKDNKDEKVTNKYQLNADSIRLEANDKLMEYSTSHQAKASSSMNLNADSSIDIKGGTVKVN